MTLQKACRIFSMIAIPLLLLGCKNAEKNNTKLLIEEVSDASEKNCINTIINTDATLGKIRNEAPRLLSLSEAIDNYIFGIEAMDFKNCPGAFEAAFLDHKEAWAAIKEVTDKYPQLRGEMHDLFDQLEKTENGERFKELLADIWSTWEKVERAMSQF
ncbi:hypothetical protein ACFQO1_04280 [Jejudonia soesokkakensis]|uniref:Lipoprotein n=1 Tax=Jejudonia soesokkakensis TaxID=1323432 RepID=A0ABW2MTM7_9FLAO